MVCAPRDLLAEVLQSLRRSSKLANLLNLESFGLLPHVLQEDGQVGRDLVRALQVLDVVARVQLLAKLFAHRFDVDDGVGELDIWLACVLEADRAKNLELFILSFGVFLFLLLFDIDRLASLSVRDAFKFGDFFSEAAKVESIVPDGANGLDQGNPDLLTDGLSLSLASLCYCPVQSFL